MKLRTTRIMKPEHASSRGEGRLFTKEDGRQFLLFFERLDSRKIATKTTYEKL